ncbi:MAG: hypothetical protein J3R72DRAFT_508487 [Linnemannia gamsii]|nr:MAG: hypothetical protein J3R72DRAFT_508487 [Linnemannia gamsii]
MPMNTTVRTAQRAGARAGADPIIRIDIPIRQIETAYHNNTRVIVRSGDWICIISQQLPAVDDNDLEVTVTFQRPQGRGGSAHSCALSQYSHLSVVTVTSENGGRLGAVGNRDRDEQGECLQEATIHRPEMLLQGVKVYVEPGAVQYRQRYIFEIQLHSHQQTRARRQQQHQQRHISQHYRHPYQRTSPTPAPTPVFPPISALRTSEVFIAAQQRLKEFLERPRGADIHITFRKQATTTATTPSPTPPSPSLSKSSSSPPPSVLATDLACAFVIPDEFQQHALLREENDNRKDSAALWVHSCILSTVSSPAMQSLLNTYPPSPPPPPPPSPSLPDPATTFSSTHFHNTLATLTMSNRGSSSNRHSPFSAALEELSHLGLFTFPPIRQQQQQQQQQEQQEPFRTIQFEDSVPEAVRAVIRYIYLGQNPVLEPYCGYTVKDLMALASYLQIPPLEEYCVQLVLGTHRDTNTTVGVKDEYDSSAVGYYYNATHTRHAHTLSSAQRRLKNRILPETAVQVLFDWGYKYPKIRTALVCALIESDLFSNVDVLFGPKEEKEEEEGGGGGGGLLRSFEGHEAFHSILCEMVERQWSRHLV